MPLNGCNQLFLLTDVLSRNEVAQGHITPVFIAFSAFLMLLLLLCLCLLYFDNNIFIIVNQESIMTVFSLKYPTVVLIEFFLVTFGFFQVVVFHIFLQEYLNVNFLNQFKAIKF